MSLKNAKYRGTLGRRLCGWGVFKLFFVAKRWWVGTLPENSIHRWVPSLEIQSTVNNNSPANYCRYTGTSAVIR